MDMSQETNKVDPVQAILTAAFGPNTAAEVTSTPEVVPPVVYVKGPDGSVYRELEAPALKLDGTPKKRTQRIVVTGFGFGAEAKREASEALVVDALGRGAESLIDLQAETGLAKLTIKRALGRLEAAGQVTSSKAPSSGRRGRPAFLYRPAVVIAPQSVEDVRTVSDTVATLSTRQDPVSGPINGIATSGVSV